MGFFISIGSFLFDPDVVEPGGPVSGHGRNDIDHILPEGRTFDRSGAFAPVKSPCHRFVSVCGNGQVFLPIVQQKPRTFDFVRFDIIRNLIFRPRFQFEPFHRRGRGGKFHGA